MMTRARSTHALAAATFGGLLVASTGLAEELELPVPAAEEIDTGDEVIFVAPVSEDRRRRLGEAAFVTVVEVDEREGEGASVADIVAEGVGARVRSLGGLGSFSSLSIRGAGAGHTTVLVDGVPLSRIASVTADLGRFTLDSLSRIEVYRGGTGLDAASAGGALNLITRVDPGDRDQRIDLSMGGGSFGARGAAARYLGRTRGTSFAVIAAYRGASGDFPYYDDNGTNLNADDDRESLRSNNGFDQGDVVLRARTAGGTTAGLRVLAKKQGIPGFGTEQTEATSLATISGLFDFSKEMRSATTSARVASFGYLEHGRYRDLDGEVGLGAQNRRYWTIAAGASAYAERAFARHLVSLALEGRMDVFDESDVASGGGDPRVRGYRPAVAAVIGDQLAFAGHQVVLHPAVRLDVMHTRPAADSNAALTMMGSPRTEVYPSPRVSALWRIGNSWALKSNAGAYFRAPTLLELFGDRGFVVGNPDLRSERGVSADFGAAVHSAGTASVDRVWGEWTLFATRAQNVIAFTSNSGGFTGAQNLGEATTAGAELAGHARVLGRLSLSANYTLMFTRRSGTMSGADGNELPQRPRHQLYGRIDADVIANRLLAWIDADMTSHSYLDVSERDPIPRRLFIGVGSKARLTDDVRAGVSVANLFDQRVEEVELNPPPSPELRRVRRAVADFFGYPLPGRAFYLTLDMTL